MVSRACPSTWIAVEGLTAGFTRQATRPVQLLWVLGASQRAPIFCKFAEGEPAGNEHLTAKVPAAHQSRALRYVMAYKPAAEPLDQFIKRKGGINACASLVDDASLQNMDER
jgi:hypothetical protein